VKLITGIRIRNFRSCAEVELCHLGDFSVLVGANNCGKSNILRALNLFFTGKVEPEEGFDLLRDVYVNVRGRRTVTVEVDFELPENFTFKKRLNEARDFLGAKFTIKKSWDVLGEDTQFRPHDERDFRDLSAAQVRYVRQFLNMLNFRFMPASRLPYCSPEEQKKLLREIVRRRKLSARLRRSRSGARGDIEQLLEEYRQSAENIVAVAERTIKEAIPDVQTLRIELPENISEVIMLCNYKVGLRGGPELDMHLQGSGLQSIGLFALQHLIDTSFSLDFGWKQATVWVIEEPELFLHTALEWNLAKFLHESSSKPGNRLQVIATTHSETFIDYCDVGFLVSMPQAGKTRAQRKTPEELVESTSEAGITRFPPPFLRKAATPIILVEGQTDKIYLQTSYRLMGIEPPPIVSPSDIHSHQADGIEGMWKALEECKRMLRSRPASAPVIAVVDWSARDNKLAKLREALAVHSTSRCYKFRRDESNPELSEHFRGIEKFLSTSFIKKGEKRGYYELKVPPGRAYPFSPYTLQRFKNNKAKLADLFKEEGQEADLEFLRQPLRDIINLCYGLPPA